MTSPSPSPTLAKVTSLADWSTFFHPTKGIFRNPFTEGETIEHLDIDLRFVDHEYDLPLDNHGLPNLPALNLPRVCVLTLRGGEYVQDDDLRIDCLAEVLLAINPVEVQWLNASNDPSEQLTFATHLVHPAIIAAGEIWSRNGSLRKLVLQGGFPCPNLTAPTPFALTPAATPCPSPGPTRTTFGSSRTSSPLSAKFPHTPFSGLPALSTTKPKPVDEEKLKARAERKRLADYTLKPRFEYAFGTWTVEELRWRLDGRYTPACTVSIITHLFRAIGSSFPSSSRKIDIDLPSSLTFTSIPSGIITDLQALPAKLDLDNEVTQWLQDVIFITLPTNTQQHARLWNEVEGTDESETRERLVRKMKAEAMLLQNNDYKLVSIDELVNQPHASPAESAASSLPSETDAATEDEDEAVTPEMSASMEGDMAGESGESKGNEASLSDSRQANWAANANVRIYSFE
ncbi:hypothetical protein CI109_101635 [Kwoniella shandongensis]|uniref:Uncharacterized protein n=1 Tax=Kwoniella shandongensis TaxID=1734106 RepID=A0A5M6C5M1_9TREE|nr:uncharacterized protein CI109_001240 [Kwoniella shandongensis]KAA5530437.1 hypothetical protein CI109_001240 [Kwoniella shandongensis]